MNQQARIHGVRIEDAEVRALEVRDSGFRVRSTGGDFDARMVLLATGVVNNRPDMPDALHDEAVRQGLLRYCPICDGYEVTDTPVAVIGTGERGFNEALFLRGYTAEVTLLAPDGDHDLDNDQRRTLSDAEVTLVDGPLGEYALAGDRISVATSTGTLRFASIYPALGSVIRSELAVALGADASPDGCLVVDAHQRTSIRGLYAAGDVVKGLDQISHAMGEGGVAATTMRNDLAADRRLYRRPGVARE